MKRRNALTVALVAIMLAPVASAYAPTHSSPAQGEQLSSTAAQGEQLSSTTAQGPVVQAPSSSDTNYTRLYIEDGYRYAEIKPGETTTYNVTVGNAEDHSVKLNPHVVLPKVQGRPLKTDWITIEDADTTLGPDEERTFTITVSVPSDVELGDYRAMVAFTNQTISYNGRPARPVHAATINAEVFKEPTVKIHGERYRDTQIKSGNSYTYEITVQNTGDKSIPLNPKVMTQSSRYGPREDDGVKRSWFEIDAPNKVAPGENATVSITVSPPESTSVGHYSAEVDLGLKDPARSDRSDYWQQVDLNFQVWKQPQQPYETTFHVSENTENVTLELSSESMAGGSADKPVSFNVTFVAPNGSVVDHERVRVANEGYVSLGDREEGAPTPGPYGSEGGQKTFTYRVENPSSGQWTVRIMPHNTMNFQYEIIRNES